MESLREVLKARDPEDDSKAPGTSTPSTSKSNPDEKATRKEESDESEKKEVYRDSSTFLKVKITSCQGVFISTSEMFISYVFVLCREPNPQTPTMIIASTLSIQVKGHKTLLEMLD